MPAEKTINLVEVQESLSETFKLIAKNHKEKGLSPDSFLVLIDYPDHDIVMGLGHPARVAALLAGTVEAHYKDLKETLLDNREHNSSEVFTQVSDAFNEQIETLIAALHEAKI